MARRCRWCNRIITDDTRIVSKSTMDFLKKECGLEDPEETTPLPMCSECLDKITNGNSDDD